MNLAPAEVFPRGVGIKKTIIIMMIGIKEKN